MDDKVFFLQDLVSKTIVFIVSHYLLRQVGLLFSLLLFQFPLLLKLPLRLDFSI
jgi:hypothetical protein